MGIPSFYRQVCRKYPNIITKGSNGAGNGVTEWLCLDFNCAMYWVLRRMRPITEANNVHTWEGEFCEAIVAYLEEIVATVKPTKGVYVSCDGVVCAAKRRQQRIRRFKGPWNAAAEAAILGKAVNSGWDQNALTPGSAFMSRLGAALQAAGIAMSSRMGIEVRVSDTEEAGEGEHKLLAHMRTVRPSSCVIYGLDADLILLSFLLASETGATVLLLRETQEFERGGGGANEMVDNNWRTLSVRGLMDAMFGPGRNPGHVRDYVAAMSLLGNDFLPHSLTLTVHNDGIPKLLSALNTCLWSKGEHMVDPVTDRIRMEGIMTVISSWAVSEEGDMLEAAVEGRKRSRHSVGQGETPEETALREWNALPAKWASVTRILSPSTRGLLADWRDIYRQMWGAGDVEAYLAGVAWAWDYYAGRPVDQGWMFTAPLPPLWTDIITYGNNTVVPYVSAPPVLYSTALPSWVHLLSVLPVDSITRLLPTNKHAFMYRHPWFWPSSWSLFDVGRGQMWECEPVIPILPEALLRSFV